MNTIEFNNVTVFYENIPVLRNINLKMEEGKIYSLIGPNGAGKSTLMETCMGFTSYEGNINLYGSSIKKLLPHQIDISYVPQEGNIYRKLTVHDNIQLARTIKKSKLDIEEIYSIFPILKERQNQVAYTLSGGEARQLAIALSLVHLQKLVLLDEPLTGLSPKMALHTLGFIKQLKEKYNVTILISEQNLEVADISDYICVLKGGEIMNQFTTADWSKLTRGEITEMVFGRTA
ncbi:MAG: branched-chain amino acid transport system ATP-binding protein [Epulopiscium sp.]|jgi:branched-chain amino acid transport system ATP-binding protein|nr:branched-chain amino acid transport system ATP-binding protein [Candidatus Epulonipiscium sp.]